MKTKEETAQYSREWAAKNREKVRLRRQKDYRIHREERIQRTKEWQEKNPEMARQTQKARRAKNPERTRELDRRNRHKKYGVTPEQFASMVHAQAGKCAICKIEAGTHIDHCHQTRKVRGLLCNNCNTGIGMLKDSVELLQSALEYLKS